MRPIIGITATYNEEHNAAATPMTYIEAVLEAGGKPLLIPVMPDEVAEENLSVIDALLIPGGVDIDPRHYNERPNPRLGRINPLLDALELGLVKKALAMNMPMLGICRGCQMITVAAGGSLVQDIGSQIGGAQKHVQQAPRWYGTHDVVLPKGPCLSVFGTEGLWSIPIITSPSRTRDGFQLHAQTVSRRRREKQGFLPHPVARRYVEEKRFS